MKWPLILGLSWLGACTAAQYRDAPQADAGAADACANALCASPKLQDAGSEDARVAATLDARDVPDAAREQGPVAALLGTYAVHTRFYGRELSTGFVELLHELIVIADITREPGGLQMRVETCEDSGALMTVGLQTDVRVKYPAKYPVRTFGVVVEGDSFHTTGEALPIGYTPDWPGGCTAGARIASSSPWHNGSCLCVEGEAPPVRAEDCRVIDSDEDGSPGMTVESSGLLELTQGVRIRDSSQYVLGVIDPVQRRHRANYKKEEELQELGCSSGDCPSYQARLCAIEKQPVSFVPLTDPDITCSEVLRRVAANQLFSGETLDGSFPPGC